MPRFNPYLLAYGAHEETHEEHGVSQHEEHVGSGEHGQSVEEHGGGGGEHEGEHGGHHIWWQFKGYEVVLGALSCIYFALFIVIIPFFFGTDLEEHH